MRPLATPLPLGETGPCSTAPLCGESRYMPRFRFTIRRMMVAVAIAGVIVGLWQRSAEFHQKAVALALLSSPQRAVAGSPTVYRHAGDDPSPGRKTSPT